MATPGAQRQAALEKRKREQGLKRIGVWIPPAAEDRLRKYVDRLVKEHANG